MTDAIERATKQLDTQIERMGENLKLTQGVKDFGGQVRDTQFTTRGRARAQRIVDAQWKRRNRPKPQKESKGFGQ